jgi:hypothetical protein
MKKIIFTIFLLWSCIYFLYACEQKSDYKEYSKESDYIKTIRTVFNNRESYPDIIQIIKIDGCEYIWIKDSNASGLVHKHNCKNH